MRYLVRDRQKSFPKSRGFSSAVSKEGDLHTGDREIESFVVNDISDIFARNMPPPSGLSLEDILLRTR